MICNICPRECNIDRKIRKGFCGMGENPVVARAFLHMWEEPCISGTRGSGTVFFSGCNLKCIFCQNHEISHGGRGREISEVELTDIFLSLRDKGAHNINLVTPTHFVPSIMEALRLAKTGQDCRSSRTDPLSEPFNSTGQDCRSSRTDPLSEPYKSTEQDYWSSRTDPLSQPYSSTGQRPCFNIPPLINPSPVMPLDIPVVYNTNGYESLETLKMLDGMIDIYLPDLKYVSPEVSTEYSAAKDYFDKASTAILEMHKQVGAPVFDDNGIMKRGIIIRHLVLPGHISETMRVLDWIAENFPKEVHISLMSQYTPCHLACEHLVIGRSLTRHEYDKVVNKFVKLGFNGYVQERESASTRYIPDFNQIQF